MSFKWAAKTGDLETLRQRLANGADPEGPGGRTPLMLAAAGGHLEAVRLLLDHGADPNFVYERHCVNILGVAQTREVIELLVTRGARWQPAIPAQWLTERIVSRELAPHRDAEEFLALLDPGDELWHFHNQGWSGTAIVRDGIPIRTLVYIRT